MDTTRERRHKKILRAVWIAIFALLLALLILYGKNTSRYVWGINLKVTNLTEQKLRYVGLSTRSIRTNSSIDFSGDTGDVESIRGVLKNDTLDDSEIECSVGCLAPGETAFVQWEGRVKGESLLFVFVNDAGLVRLVPADYVYYADSLHYVEAIITEQSGNPETGLLTLKTFDTFPGLIPWWIRIQYDFLESNVELEL